MDSEQHRSVSSTKLSGAANGKRKQEKDRIDKALLDKVPKLTTFFSLPQPPKNKCKHNACRQCNVGGQSGQ